MPRRPAPAHHRPPSPRPGPAPPRFPPPPRCASSPPAAGRAARPAASALSARGQASVEFVALLPLIALALMAAWQFVLAGDAFWQARAAARAAARAQAVGEDPREAARAHLPARLEHALRVRAGPGGDVRVSIRVPAILEALNVGRVGATAHFQEQGA